MLVDAKYKIVAHECLNHDSFGYCDIFAMKGSSFAKFASELSGHCVNEMILVDAQSIPSPAFDPEKFNTKRTKICAYRV